MSKPIVEGIPELIRKLEKMDVATGSKVLRQATFAGAKPVVDEAKIRIPIGDDVHRTYKGNLVSPGFAKRSIVRRSRIVDGKVQTSIGVKKQAFYATQFVELGVSHAPAQPWLVPAFENKRAAIVERVEKTLRRKLLKLTI